jgi:hypothetical protein
MGLFEGTLRGVAAVASGKGSQVVFASEDSSVGGRNMIWKLTSTSRPLELPGGRLQVAYLTENVLLVMARFGTLVNKKSEDVKDLCAGNTLSTELGMM